MSWTDDPVGVWIDLSSSCWTVRICDFYIEDNVYDQPIIVASPSHLAVRMLVARMRAGRSIDSTQEMEAARDRLMAGLVAWCKAHQVTLEWSETPGRRARHREYRIAYHGDNLDAADPDALYNALDAELCRLMLLP